MTSRKLTNLFVGFDGDAMVCLNMWHISFLVCSVILVAFDMASPSSRLSPMLTSRLCNWERTPTRMFQRRRSFP